MTAVFDGSEDSKSLTDPKQVFSANGDRSPLGAADRTRRPVAVVDVFIPQSAGSVSRESPGTIKGGTPATADERPGIFSI